MRDQLQAESRRALRMWKRRQKSDGSLVAALTVATLLPLTAFLFAPEAVAALVTALFLAALGTAVLRLVQSTARVVQLRQARAPDRLNPLLTVVRLPGTVDCSN
jgi:hypothetical protein